MTGRIAEPLEQPLPVKRRRGRPRKAADTAQAEPVHGRLGESVAFAAEASPPKPMDVVPPEESPPTEPDLPQPGSSGANKRKPGATSTGKPERAKKRNAG